MDDEKFEGVSGGRYRIKTHDPFSEKAKNSKDISGPYLVYRGATVGFRDYAKRQYEKNGWSFPPSMPDPRDREWLDG